MTTKSDQTQNFQQRNLAIRNAGMLWFDDDLS